MIYKNLKNIDFIGPEEFNSVADKLQLIKTEKIPVVPFKLEYLKSLKNNYILILGCDKHTGGQKLTVNSLREILGFDPGKSEPCFYNQDWYLRESFAAERELESRWYLIRKNVEDESRAQDPAILEKKNGEYKKFPSAILATYVFFVHYFLTGETLWKNDFIWCDDKDSNGDRIYVGRYIDPNGINKNGFNIHRHLSLRPCYGAIAEIIKS